MLGAASLALVEFGWFWFAICFAAPKAAWWNSGWLFIAIYSVAIVLAIVGFRSALSIIALILAASTVGLGGWLMSH